VKNFNLAVPAAVQLAGRGVSPLSASSRGAGGVCLPVTWPVVAEAVSVSRVRGLEAAFTCVPAVIAATKPEDTNIRKQYVHMTRVTAGGDGALGSYPAREPEPV
jgi:hypothetical protein